MSWPENTEQHNALELREPETAVIPSDCPATHDFFHMTQSVEFPQIFVPQLALRLNTDDNTKIL